MIAAPLVLKSGDKERLDAVLRASTAPLSLVMRARIVLLAAQGLANAEIVRQVGVSGPTVLTWRTRYTQGGLESLGDLPRSGRPATRCSFPAGLFVCRWTFGLRNSYQLRVEVRVGQLGGGAYEVDASDALVVDGERADEHEAPGVVDGESWEAVDGADFQRGGVRGLLVPDPEQEARGARGAVHRAAGGADVAAAVGGDGDVRVEQGKECRQIAAGGGAQERINDGPVLLRIHR